MGDDTDAVTDESIAREMMGVLREMPGGCASMPPAASFRWVRHVDGEWRAVRYEQQKWGYITGEVWDDEEAESFFAASPTTIIPADDARRMSAHETTVWEEAEEQDVFTDHDRCFWCGVSERDEEPTLYETTEDGECLLCDDCHEHWNREDQIAGRAVGN